MLDRLILTTAAALVAAAPLAAPAADKAVEAGRPRFDGQWTLNPARSDDGRGKTQEALGERRGGGRSVPMGSGPMAGGPSGEPMGGAGMRSMQALPPDPGEMERQRVAMDEALRAPESLLVTQEGVAFEVVRDGERVERLYADGRKNKGTSGIERKTRWSSAELVTEAKLGGGFGPQLKIRETWALVPAAAGGASPGQDLRITTRLEGGPFEKPLVLQRIYEKAPAP